ncbi:MAG: phosphatidate cytidylyltransferase [Burkholderiaceae bacterium]
MFQYLRQLNSTQQLGALFLLIFGMLLLASVMALVLSLRQHRDPALALAHHDELHSFEAVLGTSWILALVFWVGWVLGAWVTTLLFGLISFFILREFLTLSPTRRGDHRSLILTFFLVLPAQYWLVGTERFNLFSVFIPVFVFLALPAVSALANDPLRFLERNAKLQWGIMVCVFGMSHVPALLLLDFRNPNHNNELLALFLVIVVQTCMVVQHVVSRHLIRAPVAPQISLSFNWQSALIGIGVASVFGALLAGITPFVPGQAFALSFIACSAGTLGHLVMKALKRDRGVTNWGAKGRSVTGAGGLLDRVDALCFAAPVFFHSVRWYFGL